MYTLIVETAEGVDRFGPLTQAEVNRDITWFSLVINSRKLAPLATDWVRLEVVPVDAFVGRPQCHADPYR